MKRGKRKPWCYDFEKSILESLLNNLCHLWNWHQKEIRLTMQVQ